MKTLHCVVPMLVLFLAACATPAASGTATRSSPVDMPPAAVAPQASAPPAAAVSAQPVPQPSQPPPLSLAPVDGDWWLITAKPDQAGNAPVYFVNRDAAVYSLLRSPSALTPPTKRERPIGSIEPNMRVFGTSLRPSDGVFTDTRPHSAARMQCRLVLPCSLECTQKMAGADAMLTVNYRPDVSGAVFVAVNGQPADTFSQARFVPAPATPEQCQSRLLLLAAFIYEGVERSNEPQ